MVVLDGLESYAREMSDISGRGHQALAAAIDLGKRLDIACDEARIIKDSNNTIVHLAPAPLVAKVGTTSIRPDAASGLERELRIGTYLAERGAPIAPPASDVSPGPHLEDEVVITLWTYIEPTRAPIVTDAVLGETLERFHRAFADYQDDLPDFTSNLSHATDGLRDRSKTPRLSEADRVFLLNVAAEIEDALKDVDLSRHPLHGDPHLDGNILQGDEGPVFIDLEAACFGPYEWDLASLPRASTAYPDVDRELLTLLSRMRSLTVSTYCWMQYGRAPEVDEAAHVHLAFLRGPASD